jgi:hypothetical protein
VAVETIDVVLFAARNGCMISHAIAQEAVASIDRQPLEATETARYEAKAWDGKTDPPVGVPNRWLHGQDGSSRSAIEALAQPKGVVYFMLYDGSLKWWQPHRATMAGRIHMVDEPGDANHWEVDARALIKRDVEMDVDAQVLRLALAKALD